MPEVDVIPLWYAVRTRSRHEKQVRDRFATLGIEPLLPTVRRLNQWKDRKKEIECPLFPGYCFGRFPWEERLSVLKVAGVVDIIGSGNRPESIPDREIEASQNQAKVAIARYNQATSQIGQAQAQLLISQSKLKQAQAAVEQAKAQLEQATVNLQHSIIESPIDGVVVSRNVDVGQTVAASLQAVTEEIILHLARSLQRRTHMTNLCLAGGVALNSVANGKLRAQTPFREVFVQPELGGDTGVSGLVGAIWRASAALSFDAGVRLAREAGDSVLELRAGLTFTLDLFG